MLFAPHRFEFEDFCYECLDLIGTALHRLEKLGISVVVVEPPINLASVELTGKLSGPTIKDYMAHQGILARYFGDKFLNCNMLASNTSPAFIDFYHPTTTSWSDCIAKGWPTGDHDETQSHR